jgi:hypothetical protein
MDFIEYPNTGYNSYCSEDFADEFFETRSNSDAWDTASKETVIITSFRSLKELDFDITFDDDKIISTDVYTTAEAAEILQSLQEAQLEQCIYELQNDLDTMQLSYLNISGLAVKMPDKQPERFSPRALAILRPYLIARTVSRFR